MTATSATEGESAVCEAQDVYGSLHEAAVGLDPGRSSVRFTPGCAALWNSSALKTVVVVLISVDEETKREAYKYLHNLQVLTQRIRPLIVTDGHDLREIRKYGWLTEHVFDRTTFDSVHVDETWPDMVLRRVLETVKHFDAEAMVVVQLPGITEEQHFGLSALDGVDVPYAAVVPR